MTRDLESIDAERLELLDRIAERLPDLDQHRVEWGEYRRRVTSAPRGRRRLRRRRRLQYANSGENLHAVGSMAPLIAGHVGCIVIKPDGSRVLARAVPDPLAE